MPEIDHDLDRLKEQLPIALLRRLCGSNGKVRVPLADLVKTSEYVVSFSLNSAEQELVFTVSPKILGNFSG